MNKHTTETQPENQHTQGNCSVCGRHWEVVDGVIKPHRALRKPWSRIGRQCKGTLTVPVP